MNNDNKFFGCVGLAVSVVGVLILTMVITSLINGFVLVQLWGWFVMSIFEVPSLTIPQAIGVSMIVSFLTYRGTSQDDNSKKEWADIAGKILGSVVFYPVMVLGLGWIVYQFIGG